MKPTAAQLRAQLEPLIRDFATRTPAKIASIESGLSERQIREYRNENAPVMGRAVDELAKLAAQLPDEGDRDNS